MANSLGVDESSLPPLASLRLRELIMVSRKCGRLTEELQCLFGAGWFSGRDEGLSMARWLNASPHRLATMMASSLRGSQEILGTEGEGA